LEPSNAARVGRKSFEIVSRRTEPNQRLIRHNILCEYRSALSIPSVYEMPKPKSE
jgi:hypothetical protein